MAEMKYHKDRLPHNWFDKSKAEKVAEEIRQAETSLNDAIKNLTDRKVKIESVEDLQTITTDKLKAFIMQMCEKFLNLTPFVPEDVAFKTRNDYFNAYKQLCPYVEQINDILATYAGISIEFNEGKFSFVPEDVERWTNEKSTVHITKAIRDGFELYKNLMFAIDAADKWERENDRQPFAKNGAIGFSSDGKPVTISLWHCFVGKDGTVEDFTPEAFLKRLRIID